MEFSTNLPETVTDYWIVFNDRIAQIHTALDESGDRLMEHIASIKAQVADLQTYSTNSTSFLPKYDVRRSQEEIDNLRKKCADMEMKQQPRKKFSFSARVKQSSSNKSNEKSTCLTEGSTTAGNESSSGSNQALMAAAAGSVCIEHRVGETVDVNTLRKEENTSQIQLLMRNSSNCEVLMMGTLGSARFENLSNCKVYLGPCHTSVYLESCTDCTFFIWCHQLRIHKTERTDMYVHVNSHPIIEACTHMRFAPYLALYPSLADDVKATALDNSKNWNNVVDFLWHRSTPSPNWTSMDKNDYVRSISHQGWRVHTGTSEGEASSEGVAAPVSAGVVLPTDSFAAAGSNSESAGAINTTSKASEDIVGQIVDDDEDEI